MKTGYVGIWILLLAALVNCSDDEVLNPGEQQVFFQVSHTNEAWGEQNKGFLIDRDGQVRLYDNPDTWNPVDVRSGLTRQQMTENLASTAIASRKINAGDLRSYFLAIAAIKEENFTPRRNQGNDRGTTYYYAFVYDAKQEIYQPVLLAEAGDWETHNQDESAMKITSWLMQIEEGLY